MKYIISCTVILKIKIMTSFQGEELIETELIAEEEQEKLLKSFTGEVSVPASVAGIPSEHELEHLTAAHIKEINYELGLIIICWPEIIDPVFENRTHFPESYYQNSNKEKLTLLYVENFRRQFMYLFPKRRQLVLAADNECGIQKFVCNTIRPTTLPYLELKSWDGCAKFVADNIRFECFDRPTIVPERIIGPYTVFKRQLGNCYEMAICLCSLLRGAGYDAYVCSGFATQDITDYIRYRTECPIQANLPVEDVVEEVVTTMKYQLREPRDLRSKFLLGQEQKKIDKILAAEQAILEKERLEREEREKAPEDPLYGWRVHAWVLLLPKRDITEPIFIEPSTGENHPIDTDVYISLESIFSHENYWVNMQEYPDGLGSITYDLEDLSCWEHLLVGEPIEHRIVEINPDVEVEEDTPLDEKHLDAPTPWSEPIAIEHSTLTQRFVGGCKVTRYKRIILEQFGDYVQSDGLKYRINHYSDFECTDLVSIEDTYENRVDRVTAICTNIIDNVTTEYFKRGREDACKMHQFNFDENTLEMPRTMEFYYTFRLDGLQKLETDACFLKETFMKREDFLLYRHTVFAPRGQPPPGMVEGVRRIIVSITEKFARDLSKDAHDDVAVREFALADNEIHIKYHYAEGHVTASTRDFIKPSLAEMGDELIFNPTLTVGYRAEIDAKPPKQLQLYYLLKLLLREEQRSIYLIREREDEIEQFIRTRCKECSITQLEVSLFNRELNEDFKIGLKEKEQQERDIQNRELDENIDVIAPYICRLGSPKVLDSTQAFRVHEDCVNEFKELLLVRANRLRQQFEEAYKIFENKQDWFAHNVSQLNIQDEEAELNNLARIKYQLNLYDIRLQRHKDLSISRYKALITYLATDSRLAILRKK